MLRQYWERFMTDRLMLGLKAAAVAVFAWIVGAPHVYQVLMIVMVADVVSGVVTAGKRSELASAIAMKGIQRKASIWLLIFVVGVIQAEFIGEYPVVIGTYTPAQVIAAGFIFVEALSILENIKRVGVSIPYLTKYLKVARDKLIPEASDGEPLTRSDNSPAIKAQK